MRFCVPEEAALTLENLRPLPPPVRYPTRLPMPLAESTMMEHPLLPGVVQLLALKPSPPGTQVQPDVPGVQPQPLLSHAPPWAASAWYVAPRHTVSGWLNVAPFSVQDLSPSSTQPDVPGVQPSGE